MSIYFKNLRENGSLVHCITNYVTVNDVANIILAAGASPIMADDVKEVEEVVSISDALVINMGTLNERTIDSMIKAGKKANKLNIPVVFDPVGIGVSQLRRETGKRIIDEIELSVITGNISEIEYLTKGKHMDTGVDADKDIDLSQEDYLIKLQSDMVELSKDLNCVIQSTGEKDITVIGDNINISTLGHPLMEKITGAGCMLTGLIGAYVGANPENIFEAVSTATKHMGVAGKFAGDKVEKEELGTSSFKMYLIDYINKLELRED